MIEAPPPEIIRLLFLGDIVGEPGRTAVIDNLERIRTERHIDFIIVNGENTAGGRGITPKIAIALLRAGAAVITTGDHIWDQKEIIPFFETEPRLLRPMNYPPDTPGQGSVVLDATKARVAVLNAQGRTFMNPPLENPFLAVEAEVARLKASDNPPQVIFLDFHGETTSEKITMGRLMDGQISAMVGTHTHVQTADEQIFENGTAFLCDGGMCGPVVSILGREPGPIIDRARLSTPQRMPVAGGDVRLCGAVIDVDIATGKAAGIERYSEVVRIEEAGKISGLEQ
ncbi:MAG: TIGR00282 family metallophosphoesterase [Verrucomicrobiota bacterium]